MGTLVIGAGVAGLAAAQDLMKANHQVVVLEAKDRIGGRVHTHRAFAETPIELGAELLHGNQIPTWGLLAGQAAHLMPGSLPATQVPAQALPPALLGESLHAYMQRNALSSERLPPRLRNYIADFDDAPLLSAQAALEYTYDPTEGVGDFRLHGGYD